MGERPRGALVGRENIVGGGQSHQIPLGPREGWVPSLLPPHPPPPTFVSDLTSPTSGLV